MSKKFTQGHGSFKVPSLARELIQRAGNATILRYHLGIDTIEIPLGKGHRAFEVYVRADINESVLLGYSEQILFSLLGKDIKKKSLASQVKSEQQLTVISPNNAKSYEDFRTFNQERSDDPDDRIYSAPYLEVLSDISALSTVSIPAMETTPKTDAAAHENAQNVDPSTTGGSIFSSALNTIATAARTAAVVAVAAGTTLSALGTWECVRLYLGVNADSLTRVMLVVSSPAPGAVSLSALQQTFQRRRVVSDSGDEKEDLASSSSGKRQVAAHDVDDTRCIIDDGEDTGDECMKLGNEEYDGCRAGQSGLMSAAADRSTAPTVTTEIHKCVIEGLHKRPGPFNEFAENLAMKLVAAFSAAGFCSGYGGDIYYEAPTALISATHSGGSSGKGELQESAGTDGWREWPGGRSGSGEEDNVNANREVSVGPAASIDYTPDMIPVDPHYVRDSLATHTRHMLHLVARESSVLDERVEVAESDCARLMTLLKPSFTRAALELPAAPPALPLEDFQLRLRRRSVTEANLATAKEILKQARLTISRRLESVSVSVSVTGSSSVGIDTDREGTSGHTPTETISAPINNASVMKETTSAFSFMNSGSLGGSSEDLFSQLGEAKAPKEGGESTEVHDGVPCKGSRNDYDTLLKSLLAAVDEEIKSWCLEEREERLRRKRVAVAHRLEMLDAYRMQLIKMLHCRPINSAQGAASSSSSAAGIGSAADRALMASVRSKCRVLGDDEPILLDTPVTYKGRSGMLYITGGHVYFHAYESAVVVASVMEGIGSLFSGPSTGAGAGAGGGRSALSESSTNYSMKLIPIRTIASVALLQGDGSSAAVDAVWEIPRPYPGYSSSLTTSNTTVLADVGSSHLDTTEPGNDDNDNDDNDAAAIREILNTRASTEKSAVAVVASTVASRANAPKGSKLLAFQQFCITDEGGRDIVFTRVTGPSPDHCNRVAELISFLKHAKLYMTAATSTLQSSPRTDQSPAKYSYSSASASFSGYNNDLFNALSEPLTVPTSSGGCSMDMEPSQDTSSTAAQQGTYVPPTELLLTEDDVDIDGDNSVPQEGKPFAINLDEKKFALAVEESADRQAAGLAATAVEDTSSRSSSGNIMPVPTPPSVSKATTDKVEGTTDTSNPDAVGSTSAINNAVGTIAEQLTETEGNQGSNNNNSSINNKKGNNWWNSISGGVSTAAAATAASVVTLTATTTSILPLRKASVPGTSSTSTPDVSGHSHSDARVGVADAAVPEASSSDHQQQQQQQTQSLPPTSSSSSAWGSAFSRAFSGVPSVGNALTSAAATLSTSGAHKVQSSDALKASISADGAVHGDKMNTDASAYSYTYATIAATSDTMSRTGTPMLRRLSGINTGNSVQYEAGANSETMNPTTEAAAENKAAPNVKLTETHTQTQTQTQTHTRTSIQTTSNMSTGPVSHDTTSTSTLTVKPGSQKGPPRLAKNIQAFLAQQQSSAAAKSKSIVSEQETTEPNNN